MVLTLFKRKSREVSKVNQNSSIYNALINGLNEMGRQSVDRIILTLHESESSKNTTGRWINGDKETNYYPFEMLDETEQEMIMSGKHYTVVALVGSNVGDVVSYTDEGVEVYNRTHGVPFLPRMKPESELN